jgi:hypothetical protein
VGEGGTVAADSLGGVAVGVCVGINIVAVAVMVRVGCRLGRLVGVTGVTAVSGGTLSVNVSAGSVDSTGGVTWHPAAHSIHGTKMKFVRFMFHLQLTY